MTAHIEVAPAGADSERHGDTGRRVTCGGFFAQVVVSLTIDLTNSAPLSPAMLHLNVNDFPRIFSNGGPKPYLIDSV